MSSEDDIKTSLKDWIDGKNGFEYRHSWISPGMKNINNHWKGQETPAQERIADPITQHISGSHVKMMRRKSLEVVKECRQQGQERRRRWSFDFVRQFWEGKDEKQQQDSNTISNTRPEETRRTTRRASLSSSLSFTNCLLYTSPSPRDVEESRMPSSA